MEKKTQKKKPTAVAPKIKERPMTMPEKILKLAGRLDEEMGKFEEELRINPMPSQEEMIRNFIAMQAEDLIEFLKSTKSKQRRFYLEYGR